MSNTVAIEAVHSLSKRPKLTSILITLIAAGAVVSGCDDSSCFGGAAYCCDRRDP